MLTKTVLWLLEALSNLEGGIGCSGLLMTSRLSLIRDLGEKVFNYDYTWRTNSGVIGALIACMARDQVGLWDIIASVCLTRLGWKG